MAVEKKRPFYIYTTAGYRVLRPWKKWRY